MVNGLSDIQQIVTTEGPWLARLRINRRAANLATTRILRSFDTLIVDSIAGNARPAAAREAEIVSGIKSQSGIMVSIFVGVLVHLIVEFIKRRWMDDHEFVSLCDRVRSNE